MPYLHRLRAFWRTTSLLDRAAAIVFIFFVLSWATPLGRYLSSLGAWRVILFVIAAGYLIVRLLRWARRRLLWGLRNRLIVAYIFIAVVPVVLLLAMVALSGYLLYFQLGAHLLQDDLSERVSEVSHIAETLDETIENDAAKGLTINSRALLERPGIAAMLTAAGKRLPGLEVHLPESAAAIGSNTRPVPGFTGLAQSAGNLWIEAVVASRPPSHEGELYVRVPVSAALLSAIAPDLGPIQLTTFRYATPSDPAAEVLNLNGSRLVRAGQVASVRPLQPKRGWYDIEISGGSTLNAVLLSHDEPTTNPIYVAAAFSLRPSQMNSRLFASLGLLGDPLVIILILIGVFFLVLEVAALATGVVLTRTITVAVDDLYEATRHVRQGDFRHRIHVRQRDQLGVLAESFNAMTGSISELIEEQRQRQKLENELTIAREVQTQLFPRALPEMAGLELAAVCRAARVVSGDYYDFVNLGHSRLGMAIADISGKGISAALLMASLQAALRGQALVNGHRTTAEVVSSLNRHLFLNTSDDRYATLFYAEYDAASRSLCYTNAGHCAPFFVTGNTVKKLDEGGTVVGLFDRADYKQVTVPAEPGSLFVGFSDGLLEPENVYGEEFGTSRLANEVLRLRDAPAERLADGLLSAVEQWAGSPEQADDMTVIVARFR
ncbi:MAG TPA: PP2C family protein-serine/threonine phosphatase [Candidatus Acidoferrales bacterium]|nr:PP2C family protein-serine/threonine phosphatase [Candidatus Acidoferrales bacterium]HEV2422711.1 PP2C family protein-serine/threonine phosphatase [Candidatus Acidoferrales bacterium]